MKAARECGEDEFELQDLDEYYGIWFESLNCRDSQVNAVERRCQSGVPRLVCSPSTSTTSLWFCQLNAASNLDRLEELECEKLIVEKVRKRETTSKD